MMKILLQWYKQYKTVYIPKEIEERNNEYLTFQSWSMKWFKEHYKKSHDERTSSRPSVDDQHLKLKEVFDELKTSDEYMNQDFKEKRNLTYHVFLELFKKDPLFKNLYVEKCQTGPENMRKCERNILKGYCKIIEK